MQVACVFGALGASGSVVERGSGQRGGRARREAFRNFAVSLLSCSFGILACGCSGQWEWLPRNSSYVLSIPTSAQPGLLQATEPV